VKISWKVAIPTAVVAVSTALILAQTPGPGQGSKDEKAKARAAAKAKQNAQIFELNARTLTLFDRDGKRVAAVGQRALYNTPVLSPDGKRIAAVKADLEKESRDLWVLDAATGRATRITTSQTGEGPSTPVGPRTGAS